MNLVTFFEPCTISFRKSSGSSTFTFEPGREYLFASNQVQNVMQNDGVSKRVYKVSKAEMRIQNFHVGCRRAGQQRLLLFQGGGGFGDEIMTWPVAKILTDIGFEVHILTHPGNNICWWNAPFCRSVQTVPILWETVKMYDYFVSFEQVVNADEHQDQKHPVDMMLYHVGIDPRSVDNKLKTVRPRFTASEVFSSVAPYKDKAVAIYQMSAANPIRCLQPSDSLFMLIKLAEAFQDLHWIVIYDEFIKEDYLKLAKEKVPEFKNVELKSFANLRELWALTDRAKVVVAPDSMMVHIAGSLSAPCVGLWGPISPENRVCYYQNHFPIFHKRFCPHAPCFCYMAQFPKYCPPRPGAGARTTCEVLAGISPIDVIDAVAHVRRK